MALIAKIMKDERDGVDGSGCSNGDDCDRCGSKRVLVSYVQLMEYNHSMYTKMRANGNDGRWICKSNDACG